MRQTLLMPVVLIFLVAQGGDAQTGAPPILSNPRSSHFQEMGLPEFHIYKTGLLEGVSVVVPPATTDQQLKALLWYFRKTIRQGSFRAVGITKPTTERFGKRDYSDGLMSVYRGAKCANELFVSSDGPCGHGDHVAASYQWGIEGDPAKDSGILLDKNGDYIPVFDYKDKWKPLVLVVGEMQPRFS
jgi:hypothetical protein